jgi:hypothetical protein
LAHSLEFSLKALAENVDRARSSFELLENENRLIEDSIYRLEKGLGPGQPDTSNTVETLRSVREAPGKWKDADVTRRRHRPRSKKILGPRSRERLTTINNLGGVLKRRAMDNEAKSMDGQAKKLKAESY